MTKTAICLLEPLVPVDNYLPYLGLQQATVTILSFTKRHPAFLYVATNVSEEHTASVFRTHYGKFLRTVVTKYKTSQNPDAHSLNSHRLENLKSQITNIAFRIIASIFSFPWYNEDEKVIIPSWTKLRKNLRRDSFYILVQAFLSKIMSEYEHFVQ